MKQVEIFKTDVRGRAKVTCVLSLLEERYPAFDTNFDMDDDDRILRVESRSEYINGMEIESLLNEIGVYCKILTD